MRFLVQIGTILSVLAATGCQMHETKYSDTPTSGRIVMYADETFRPILDAEQMVFESLYNQAKIDIRYTTETDALNNLFRDSAYLTLATRPLNDTEMTYFEEKKLFPKSLLIAKDAIALLINPANTDTLLSVNTLKDILTGVITRWEQIPGARSKGPIAVVFDNKNSSTVRYMLDSVCSGAEISDHHMALEKNQQVIEYIENNPLAIGIIGVGWISDRDDPSMLSFLNGVKIMYISKADAATPSNSYQPFQAYIWDGRYPFIRNIYLINAEPRKGLATGFSAFIASDRGQRIILKTGILPATQPFRIIEVKDNLNY